MDAYSGNGTRSVSLGQTGKRFPVKALSVSFGPNLPVALCLLSDRLSQKPPVAFHPISAVKPRSLVLHSGPCGLTCGPRPRGIRSKLSHFPVQGELHPEDIPRGRVLVVSDRGLAPSLANCLRDRSPGTFSTRRLRGGRRAFVATTERQLFRHLLLQGD